MVQKRIVCTIQTPYGNAPECAKIISVGASSGGNVATEELLVSEVIRQIDNGIVFYTHGLGSGKTALVIKYYCTSCRSYHIKTAADSVFDNNLDRLRFCEWKQAV